MNASDAQIENAYRTLVKVWHPDRFQSDPKLRASAEEKLKEINSAHEFLISGEAARPQTATKSKQPERIEEPVEEAPPVIEEPVRQPELGEETREIRRILRRQRRRKVSLPKALLQTGFLVGAIAILAILWLAVDAILMSNPKTAGPWEQYKAELGRDLHSTGLRMWSDATDNLHSQKGGSEAAAVQQPDAAPNPTPVAAAPESSGAEGGPSHSKASDSQKSVQPYVTEGLTPMEVLAILGNPTQSSGEKLFYKNSEIDFKNGHVAGWNIDPKTSPVRVKLWPTAVPASGLSQFALGSSKSDVIALQGTPTLFSDNKFGYGNSVVLFKNDRVVGWQEDPNSVRLRVAH